MPAIITPGRSEFENKLVHTGYLIETFSKNPDQDNQFFLRWTWSFNRDFLGKFRPGSLIEQAA